MAVSVDLLSFFHVLFERSCDTIHALASALGTYYSRRGFHVTDHKVSDIPSPYSHLTIERVRAEL